MKGAEHTMKDLTDYIKSYEDHMTNILS